jgi:hypothetical protein
VDPILQKEYGGHYLYQIWNKTGVKVYEKVMNGPVQMQENCGNAVVYRPAEGEANSDYYHIVDCENGCSVLRVKNWAKKSVFQSACYSKGLLFLSTEEKINIVKLDASTLKPGEVGPLTEFKKE